MSGFLVLQIAGFAVLVAILGIIIQNIRKEKSDIFTWLIVAILLAMIVIDIFPFDVAKLLFSIGFARPLDAFIVMLAGISLLLAVKIYAEQKKIRKDITKIVRKMAVDKR